MSARTRKAATGDEPARPVELHYVGDDSTYVVGLPSRGTFEVPADEVDALVATELYAKGPEPEGLKRDASPIADRPAPEPLEPSDDEPTPSDDESANPEGAA